MSKEEDTLEFITNCISAIQSDTQLKNCFIEILKIDSLSQQVRVARLLEETKKLKAPKKVTDFIQMLGNEQLANKVLSVLEET